MDVSKKRINGYVSKDTATKKSPIHGLGMFAKKNLKAGEIVAGWGGHLITEKELRQLPVEIAHNYALEVYPGFYLAEISKKELDRADFINHSCNPNCKVVKKLIMIAKRNVAKGEELTCDFSVDKTSGIKTLCNCRNKNCKKIIYF